MTNKNPTMQLKSKIKKHYVRKTDFEALAKEVKRQKKVIAKLEKTLASLSADNKTLESQPPKITVPATLKRPMSVTGKPQEKLTRIKGIGPVLEGKLHSLGITQISQIANWGEEDIRSFSEHLRFKGRIEREGWVNQAKDLLST